MPSGKFDTNALVHRPRRDDRIGALRAWGPTPRGLGQGLVSQTTQNSAARHARTRSGRTSVSATNNRPRRRVLLTRSVQKDLGEPRPPGKVSTGRMACDLCAPHASPSPSDGVAADTCQAVELTIGNIVNDKKPATMPKMM